MSTFGGRLARQIFLACGERNPHRKEEAQMTTVQPDPSNGGTALTRTVPAPAS